MALRRSMGPSLFDRMVRDKVQPIDADLAQPDLGLSDENRKLLAKHIHIVLHCAGTVDGNERLDLAIKVNDRNEKTKEKEAPDPPKTLA